MKINAEFVARFAGKPSTDHNGAALVDAGRCLELYKSPDDTLLFGSFQGSSPVPYHCSVDLIDSNQPIARCDCPSRQNPCKHAIGLLHASVRGLPFTVAELPADILEKRGKLEKRRQTAAERAVTAGGAAQAVSTPQAPGAPDAPGAPKAPAAPDAPQAPGAPDAPKAPAAPDAPGGKTTPTPRLTKASAATAAKKCRLQAEGIDRAEKIVFNLVTNGLQSIDKKSSERIRSQVQELGNYSIGGIQASLIDLLNTLDETVRTQQYTAVIDRLNTLYALIKKSRTYTATKAADYESYPNLTMTAHEDMVHSRIEEQMGTAWRLTDLAALGLCRANEELLQLAFHVFEDTARSQWVDEGIWLSLSQGEVFVTHQYRPFRAKRFLNPDDSFFGIKIPNPLYIYPGELNPRVRWEDTADVRATAPEDFARALTFAQTDFAAVIKRVHDQGKNPLATREPLVLLKVHHLLSGEDNTLAIVDETGTSLVLSLEYFGDLLLELGCNQIEGQALLCRFSHDLSQTLLYTTPLAVVSSTEVIRLFY